MTDTPLAKTPSPNPPPAYDSTELVEVRERELSAPVDVLIIGGGIVGSAIARDAAMRGLKTLIVDRYDFAFGTSSRSSRLLHGGLRYLAQGRVGLVREASHEKVILSRIAPHLAAPLPFIFPTYRKSEWKKWKLRIGVKIYDWLCGSGNLGKSTGLSREEALEILPGLQPERLTGGVRYFDGLTNDARLVLDHLRSAAKAGATVSNYVGLESAKRRGDFWACSLRDGLTGDRSAVSARVVINAAGGWADRFPASNVKLRLTKGVHLVIERSRLPVPDAVVMAEGSRILFAIPWGERVILGTTDTDYTGPLESPSCDEADLAYVLKVANATFTQANLSEADVISTWSGLRPLIADPKGRPSDISRAHQIIDKEPGWIDVAGGKLTTCRLMAEQAVDRVYKQLNHEAAPCLTAEEPVLSGMDATYSGITPPPVSREAVEHFCRDEWATHLDDVMIRRSSWRYYHRDQLEIATRVATWMGEVLGWTAEQTAQELARYEQMTKPLATAWIPPSMSLEVRDNKHETVST